MTTMIWYPTIMEFVSKTWPLLQFQTMHYLQMLQALTHYILKNEGCRNSFNDDDLV